jgi:hypothetical protein
VLCVDLFRLKSLGELLYEIKTTGTALPLSHLLASQQQHHTASYRYPLLVHIPILRRPNHIHGVTETSGSSGSAVDTEKQLWSFLYIVFHEFLIFVSPILPVAASIPCTLIYCGFAAASTYFGYMAMKIDPKDPRLSNPEGAPTSSHIDPDEPTKQCWICDVQVGEKSMHCKFCNKCVDHFDHHCMCK